jgi:hypothetical protein
MVDSSVCRDYYGWRYNSIWRKFFRWAYKGVYPKYQPGSNNNIVNIMYFRMVRGNSDYGNNDFNDNSDWTISDSATGLMWQASDDGTSRDWEEALFYAESLSNAMVNKLMLVK